MSALSALNIGLSQKDLSFRPDLLNSHIPISILAKIGMYLNPHEAARISSTCRSFAASKLVLEQFTCAEWKKEVQLVSELIPVAASAPTLETSEDSKLKFSLHLLDVLLALPEGAPDHLPLIGELKLLKVPVLAAFVHHKIVREALTDVNPVAGLSKLSQYCEELVSENRLVEALAIVSKMPLSVKKTETLGLILHAGHRHKDFILFLQKSPLTLSYSYALRDLVDGMIGLKKFKEAKDIATVIPDPFVKARTFTSIDVSQYPLVIRLLPESCKSAWQQASDVMDIMRGNQPLFRFRI